MTSRISSNQQLLRLGADTVTVVIEPDALSRLPQMLKACDADAVVLVVDEWLWPMHARTVTGLRLHWRILAQAASASSRRER